MLGWQVEKSNRHQDIDEHWDFKLTKNSTTYLVDVKAMKRLSRQDPSTQANFHYVEITNVKGKPGWLYGQADFFAFEVPEGFMLIAAEDLKRFIDQSVDKTLFASKAKNAYKKVFQRPGRADLITLVTTQDLKEIVTYVWYC